MNSYISDIYKTIKDILNPLQLKKFVITILDVNLSKKTIMKYISVFTSLIFILGALTTFGQEEENHRNNIDAQSIDTFSVIKNSKIYYYKKGVGSPAVIFVSGLGEDHKTWEIVQDSISKISLTISYDRSGLGKSEYNREKKDLSSLAHELKELINSLKVQKPFILVGHSLGCQIIKKYTSLYSKNVKGLIFIDPGYSEQKLRARITDSVWQKREETLKMYLPEFNEAQESELNNLNSNCKMADRITKLPQTPIVLFTATRINPDFPGSSTELQIKMETHRLWLNYLPWAKHIEVKESRHYIHNDTPKLIIDTLFEMIHQSDK